MNNNNDGNNKSRSKMSFKEYLDINKNEARNAYALIKSFGDAENVIKSLKKVGLKGTAPINTSAFVSVELYNLKNQQILIKWMEDNGYDKKDIEPLQQYT